MLESKILLYQHKLDTQDGPGMEILDATKPHKWLCYSCFLSTWNAGNKEADSGFRLQAPSKAFCANKWILCDNVSLNSRLKFSWPTQIVQS